MEPNVDDFVIYAPVPESPPPMDVAVSDIPPNFLVRDALKLLSLRREIIPIVNSAEVDFDFASQAKTRIDNYIRDSHLLWVKSKPELEYAHHLMEPEVNFYLLPGTPFDVAHDMLVLAHQLGRSLIVV